VKTVFTIFLLPLCLFSCKKSTTAVEKYGVVRDFTGLDGCTILIVLDNGQKLEIRSLPNGITLNNDKRVAITYSTVSGVSICMAGAIADITSLRYL
jgi:hypothetical protein